MRKIFALLSLLIVASMVLAACGGGQPASPQEIVQTVIVDGTPQVVVVTATPEGPAPVNLNSKDPKTFLQVVFGEPETFDPALAYDTASGEVVMNVYEPLVFYDGVYTDKFVGLLAESWEVSADGTVYTFKIRQGVKFHEGQDMTPSDVAYTFQRGLLFGGYHGPQWLLAEPFFGTGLDDITYLVDDGDSADDRDALKANDAEVLKAACEKVKSVIVADDANWTVTMTLIQPWGPFIPTITQTWGGIMNKDWTIANGGWDDDCATWQDYYNEPSESNPFSTITNGTGPFKLDHWTPGEEVVLVRFDDYWREPAKLERVVTKFVNEWGTRFAMMQAGDADFVAVPPENRIQMDALVGEIEIFDLDKNEYLAMQEVCGFNSSSQGVEKFTACAPGATGTGGPFRLSIGRPSTSRTDMFLNFNVVESSNYVGSGKLDGNGIPRDFFSDVNIRKAFAYCFDWDVYINDVFDSEAVQSPVVPLAGMPGYQADMPVYSYDAAKCEEHFKLADVDKDGIPAGEDPEGDVWTTGFRLQALYNQGNTTRQTISEILAGNLASVNDKFVVETVGLPWPTFLRTIRNREAPYFASGWVEDIHDPHNWYVPYLIGTYAARQNLPDDLKNQFKDLINQGVSESDPAKRQAIYEQLNQLYYDEVPTVLLAVATSHFHQQRWVKGVVHNPMFFGYYFYPMYKD
jgi:peptide/nickel transport system substrate-binding protein